MEDRDCSDVMPTLESNEYCGLVTSLSGSPFEECFNSQDFPFNVVMLAESCLHDVCNEMENVDHGHDVACETLRVYASWCGEAGFRVDWRDDASCGKDV